MAYVITTEGLGYNKVLATSTHRIKRVLIHKINSNWKSYMEMCLEIDVYPQKLVEESKQIVFTWTVLVLHLSRSFEVTSFKSACNA